MNYLDRIKLLVASIFILFSMYGVIGIIIELLIINDWLIVDNPLYINFDTNVPVFMGISGISGAILLNSITINDKSSK
jgi:hypothetical protein